MSKYTSLRPELAFLGKEQKSSLNSASLNYLELSMKLEKLFMRMFEFYSGDPKQIQHFIKVHSFARRIGLAEGLDEGELEILEAAAVVHDIGIKPALEKHGSSSGNFQELEGPPVAEQMLRELGYAAAVVERVCYLVGHHHSYDRIDGADYQILVEADFLVNIYEGGMSADSVRSVLKKIFRTETGTRLCNLLFQPN